MHPYGGIPARIWGCSVNDDVEILAIGTELVSGLILDTNSHWLAGEISLAGGQVTRITALADDKSVIVNTIQSAVDRSARLLVTTGGLGPTPDDLTVDAISEAAGCGVRTPDEVLADYAQRRGVSLSDVLTPPRLKMASVPAVSTVYLNPVGWAPCFAVHLDSTMVWSMPGPPKEVEACFTTHIRPLITDLFSGQTARMRVKIDAPESETSPLMQRVMQAYPSAYLKAYVGLWSDAGLPVDIVVRDADGHDPSTALHGACELFVSLATAAGKTVVVETQTLAGD